MRITVVGEGQAVPVDADLVVGGRRHLAGIEGVPTVELGPLAPALDAVAAAQRPAVVASGDPGFFGMVRVLAERFGAEALDVRPGVSSVATAFARTGIPWDDAVVVSAHGAEGGRSLRRAVNVCRARRKVAVLTGPGAGPAELGAALAGTNRVLLVAQRLGTPEESVVEATPEAAAGKPWDPLNVTLVIDPDHAVGGPVWTSADVGPARWALDEDAFTHRDSMITKSEVRALALAHLGPRLGDLVWDIGAGSGSVAVECARFGAAAVAVERSADGAERIRANAAAHGVDLQVVHGEAPDVLAGLPDPDAVFVGGGGPDVVAECARRALRSVVVTLAAVDRVPATRRALADAGLRCDGVLLQSSRLAPLPDDAVRLSATNPVFVLWGERP
ncbi:MAG: precorrin-6B C5,15-methyltransferase / cobalt-precorrin-6B C5,C15-methyltransferase [Actinomycetota bacterium]|jgi:precorrin-6Y C5,15-methyltransferase (decarboxylating)|nr:precorrin-6B C5,15-methyltransferase / cobalt-precorrin-6B C5,C15-methyltransferase [Actinomycetota bacterium]